MGWLAKAFGRWGDDTEKIARQISGFLDPGEEVLAAVYVQRPGTRSARIQGGASGATAGAIGADTGNFAFSIRDGAAEPATTGQKHGAAGVDPRRGREAIKLIFALTPARALLVGRSYLTGRVGDLLAAWPLREIEEVNVPQNGNSLRIVVAGTEVHCELPNDHRFIAQVYRDLPRIFAEARGALEPEA